MITQEFRPRTWDEVVGQDLNVAILKAIVKSPKNSPRSIILQGEFGTGKCVLGSTRVATSEGYLEIRGLVETSLNGFVDYKTNVWTRKGIKSSSHFYREGKCKVNILNLQTGYSINGTDAHRVLSYYKGRVGLHPLGDLCEGDYILFPRSVVGETWEEAEEWAYCYGLFLGDGYTSGKDVGFCGTYDMCTKFSRISGWTGKITRDKRKQIS